MYFTLMETNQKRYIMFDNHTNHVPYDTELLAREASFFRSRYSCMGIQGFLVLSPPKGEEADFSATFYSEKGCREEVLLDEAVCAVEFAGSLGIPPTSGTFTAGKALVHYEKNRSPGKAALHISGNFDIPLSPSFFRYGTENLCFYSLNLPGPHGVILLDYPGIFHSSELLFLAKTLANDPLRFPRGGDVSFIESAEEERLQIRTYVREENRISPSSSEGAVACAMVYHGLHPEKTVLRIASPWEEKIISFSCNEDLQRISFTSRACCISKGTVLEKEIFCGAR
jgi:diaminopimelate epimerase